MYSIAIGKRGSIAEVFSWNVFPPNTLRWEAAHDRSGLYRGFHHCSGDTRVYVVNELPDWKRQGSGPRREASHDHRSHTKIYLWKQ